MKNLFKKLLADNMAQATERASSMFDTGGTNRAAMMKERGYPVRVSHRDATRE